MRSEDELRAAFQQKAAEAPPAADVVRAVRAREAAPQVRRRWLVPAIAGAVAVAVGVPLGIALSHPSGSGTKYNAGARHAESSAPSPGTAGGLARPEAPNAASIPICGQADVVVRIQSESLQITSQGTSCLLARVPSVQIGATPAAPAHVFGTLAPHATATAPLHWAAGCAGPAPGVLRVDWGAGPVAVHVAATPGRVCSQPSPTPSAGPFTGLQ